MLMKARASFWHDASATHLLFSPHLATFHGTVDVDVILTLTGHHKIIASQVHPLLATPFPSGTSLPSRIMYPSKPQIPLKQHETRNWHPKSPDLSPLVHSWDTAEP